MQDLNFNNIIYIFNLFNFYLLYKVFYVIWMIIPENVLIYLNITIYPPKLYGIIIPILIIGNFFYVTIMYFAYNMVKTNSKNSKY